MADIKGLVNDPEFKKLDLATQKSTLGQLDPDFASLSDSDYQKFVQGMNAKPKLSDRLKQFSSEHPYLVGAGNLLLNTIPGIGAVNEAVNPSAREVSLGALKELGSNVVSAVEGAVPGSFLIHQLENYAGVPNKLEKLTEINTPGERVGALGAEAAALAASAPGAIQSIKALRAARASTLAEAKAGSSDAVRSIINKIPQKGTLTRFLADRVPGVRSALDLTDLLVKAYGPELEAIPAKTRVELDVQLWNEMHPDQQLEASKLNQRWVERVKANRLQFAKETRASMTPPKLPKPEPVPKTEDPFEDTRGKVGKQLKKFTPGEEPHGPANPPQPRKPGIPGGASPQTTPEEPVEDPFSNTRGKVGKQLKKFGGTKSPEYGPAYGRPKPRLRDRLAPEAKAETGAEEEPQSDLERQLKDSLVQAKQKSGVTVPSDIMADEDRAAGLSAMESSATVRTTKMANHFLALNKTPQEVMAMRDIDFNKIAGDVLESGGKKRPFVGKVGGKSVHRTPFAAKKQVAELMQNILEGFSQ